jgi:uncharacterized protein HemX
MRLNTRDLIQALVLALLLGFSGYLWSGVEEAKKTDTELKVYKAQTSEQIKNLDKKVEEIKQDTTEIKQVKALLETLIKLQQEEQKNKDSK